MISSEIEPHGSIVLEIMKKRYSCRKYRSDPIDQSRLAAMKEAVRLAPSACNRQPYTFLFITRENIIREIAQSVPLGPASVNSWMETAPLIIAAVGKPELFWHKLTQVIDSDYHRTDAVIAMDHLSLVATEIGLGSCWVGWFNRKKVGKILQVKGGEEVVILMTVGFPEKEPALRKGRKEIEELVVER